MPELLIASVAFNAPWSIQEQIRLFHKHVKDDHEFIVCDNSTYGAEYVEGVCRESGTRYVRMVTERHEHPEALNQAASMMLAEDCDFIGFVDHDLWPAEATELVPIIEKHGFLGIGQRHPATDRLYLWPGCAFFSREWLNGRTLDFGGIRGETKASDGDCGSMLWPLFTDEDWSSMFLFKHGYEPIRKPDDHGLQSWGWERIGPFRHASNVSNWREIPDPAGRTRVLQERVAAL